MSTSVSNPKEMRLLGHKFHIKADKVGGALTPNIVSFHHVSFISVLIECIYYFCAIIFHILEIIFVGSSIINIQFVVKICNGREFLLC